MRNPKVYEFVLQEMGHLQQAMPLCEEAVKVAIETENPQTQIYKQKLEDLYLAISKACALSVQSHKRRRTSTSGVSSGRAQRVVGAAAAALSRSVSSLSLSSLSSSSSSFGRRRGGKRAANGVRV